MIGELMRLRLRGDGPKSWKFRIEDADSGKLLPVMDFTLSSTDGILTLTATLMVSDVEIEGVVNIGAALKALAAKPEPETVEEFAASTLALVLEAAP